jgi:hypothetical protein
LAVTRRRVVERREEKRREEKRREEKRRNGGYVSKCIISMVNSVVTIFLVI